MSLRHISQFVKTNSHTNVIIATAPHRYDSVASSVVNEEVLKFNRKLKKYMKQNTHATILEIEHDRKYFTNQSAS
jgi:uridine phosphorylase